MMDMQLYADDLVASTLNEKQLAVVERTHDEIDTHAPDPGRDEQSPIQCERTVSRVIFRQFLKDGIPPEGLVVVRWQSGAYLELMPPSKLKLLDRSLLMGDVVKRRMSDAMSGIVLNTFTKCTLQPMHQMSCSNSKTLKGILPPWADSSDGMQFHRIVDDSAVPLVDIPMSELKSAESVTEDDLVIFKDWIGRVEGIINTITVRLTDNCVVEIADEAGKHFDGAAASFCIGDIVVCKKGDLRTGHWIYGQYNPNTMPVGSVVFVQTVGADIIWLQRRIGSPDEEEPPAFLGPDELDSTDFRVYDRTKRPHHPPLDINTPPETISNSELEPRLDLRVRFRDLTGACLKYSDADGRSRIPRHDRRDNLGYDLNVFGVTSFRTDVAVQWQDLSITTEDSITLVPDSSIDDEHAAWPSEIVHSLDMHAMPSDMPGMKSPSRVGVIQSVDEVERMARVKWCPQSYIHYSLDPDEPAAPANIIYYKVDDSLSSTVESVSLYEVEAPAAINVRRGDIVFIGPSEFSAQARQPGDIDWLGEIVDTRLDGKLIVRLSAALNVRDVLLSREQCVVAVRSDDTDQPSQWDNGAQVAFGDSDDEEMDSDDSDEYDEEGVDVTYEDENGNPLAEEDVEDEAWESAEEDQEEDDTGNAKMANETSQPGDSLISVEADGDHLMKGTEHAALSSEAPESYAVLDGEIPTNHHFRGEPTTTTPTHMKRTQKEHKILRNPATLPDGVFIRTWESRLDLLRVLLIGPTETPYASAPFIVDFYLPPSFPTDPPRAFFHSWPPHSSIGGIGRANPNLYEDGKICLSILGTWEGDKSEGWVAARSTLLQVIVSLLGLVLVREPYFNEAGYESLVGSAATRRPSALYSERIYLRAKGFLITVMDGLSPAASRPVSGLEGMEGVMRWLYVKPEGPRLLDVMIADVEAVLERSEDGGEPNGLTIMSKGACIPLRRVLDRLKEYRT